MNRLCNSSTILRNLLAIPNRCRTALIASFSMAFFGAPVAMAQAPTAVDFQRVVVAEGLDLPMEFAISKDGRIFVVSKCGKFYGWNLDGGVATQTSTVPNVRCVFEDGLLSVALDPQFTQNGYVYVQYTSPGSKTRVSRFTVQANNALDTASEKILLEWITGNEAHGHMGGSLVFDNDGNLIITTGDNNAASGYFAAGAQTTSGNTNDLRGKVLRIKPTAAGGYTIPAGNLFPADATHRAEIYGMGFRNPFRINIDPATGYLYLGDIGPDASADSAEGPGGLDELNELREAGNYGWPYIIGYNQPYAGYNATTIVNNASGNTGAKNLPAAKPALWTIRHQATMAGPVYRFDDAIENDFKLPAYYDGRLIFWDFNSSKFSTINLAATDNPPVAEDMPINTGGVMGAIDAELDPRTHQLYVMQWGSGCCDKEPFGNGVIYRYDYIGDRDNGPNLALGATVNASSNAGGNTAAKAVDGDVNSRWESASSNPQTFELTLTQSAVIGTIVIKWEAAYSSKYLIEASADGTNWDTLVTQNKGGGKTELHIISNTNAYKYIRFSGLERATNYGHSFYELEVYAAKEVEPEKPLTEHAYLNMPRTLDASFTGVPKLLSQTGAFINVSTVTPATHLLPFTPNSPLWSDRAEKFRWISLPKDTKIQWSAKDSWIFPEGTVAIKQFDLPVDARNPSITKRLETRLIVTKADGTIYGVTYKWRADNSDADLLTSGDQQTFSITNADGSTATQTWHYPSPADCLSCHNQASSKILGASTRQLNGNYTYADKTENQLVRWNNLGLFSPALNNAQVGSLDKLAALSDTSASLEKRVKSYLDANCAHCHGTGNGGSQWDARFNTPVSQMKIINAGTTGIRDYQADYGITAAKVIAAGDVKNSILYLRDKSIDPNDRMPPIGRAIEHKEYIALLDQWITSLGTPSVVPGVPGELTPVTATASSILGGNNAAAGIDGNIATRWESQAKIDPQYLQLDMGKNIYFTQVVLRWEPAYAKSYTIDVSEDGDTWKNAYTTTTGRGGVETIALDGQKGRYIRMHGTVRATDYGYSLWEFEAYGLEAVNNIALIDIAAPISNAVVDQTQSIKLKVDITDPDWLNSNGFVYSLDNAPAIVAGNTNEIDLGILPTGQHSIRVSLIDSNGNEVGVPRTRKFRVSCGSACPNVLIFSKTAGFRHDSIPAGIAMVQQIAADNGFTVTASEDSTLFTVANLAKYSTIVFMNTTGDIFTADQRAAFKSYIENGGGFVGTHAAADTEHNWDWYTDTLLGGGEFIHHGDGIPRAKVVIEKTTNVLVNHIGTEWMLSDEWYFWNNNPRASSGVEVLGTLDRSSYTSNYPVADHPVIYTNSIGKGRTFYTAVGHVEANFADPKMIEMIRKAIEWTSNLKPVVSSSSSSLSSSSSSLFSSSRASSSLVVASSSRSSSVSSASSSVVTSSVASSSRSSSSAVIVNPVSSSSSSKTLSSSSSVVSSSVASSSVSSRAGASSISSTRISSAMGSSSVVSSSSSISSSVVVSSVASSSAASTGGDKGSGGGGGAVAWIELLLLSLFGFALPVLKRANGRS
ncbi:MAG: hypothetical protein B0W54_09660 [Cellvibrio sp. 79]|nr:MAG: hypothetical protein B0W54_09660 [Cellvibrio sp. 79]